MAKENYVPRNRSSNVGKSILCTALCHIFYRKVLKPFLLKAQNMALNSYVIKWGDEIGRDSSSTS